MSQVGIEMPPQRVARAAAAAAGPSHLRRPAAAAAGLSLEHDDADGDGGPTPLAYDMLVVPTDFTLETLHAKWRNGKIVMPSLERGYSWGLHRASRLIESFMMGLPVPPVYLSTTDERTSVVVDGLQRLLTVFSYLEGTFAEGTPHSGREFRIAGINEDSALYGRTFDELDEDDRRRLMDSSLRVMTVIHNDPADWPGMYEIFERLNSGGAPLAPQEVRACAYHGPLSEMLGDLNGLEEWRDVIGSPDPDPRMKDRELVLRYMALYHEGDRYAHPMKEFLSRFMGARRDPGEGYLEEERRRFVATCRAVTEGLGPAPFNNKDGQLRVPLFDSVFVAFARNRAEAASCPGDIAERFGALRSDPEFGRHAGVQNAPAGTVGGRLRLARKMLFE